MDPPCRCVSKQRHTSTAKSSNADGSRNAERRKLSRTAFETKGGLMYAFPIRRCLRPTCLYRLLKVPSRGRAVLLVLSRQAPTMYRAARNFPLATLRYCQLCRKSHAAYK